MIVNRGIFSVEGFCMKLPANMFKTYTFALLYITIFHQMMCYFCMDLYTVGMSSILNVFRQYKLSELIRKRQCDADRQKREDGLSYY